MKNGKKILIFFAGVLVLAGILVGAVIGYDRLTRKQKEADPETGRTVPVETKAATETETAQETKAASETKTEAESVKAGSSESEKAPDGSTESDASEHTASDQSEDPGTPAGETDGASSESAEVFIAPDFTMVDKEGNTVSLSDYFDKPAVLNFWASWCPPCREEMPYFEEAYKEYGDRIHFLFVNLTDGGRETVETADQYIAEQGYSFPIYYDTEYLGAYTYGVNSIPMTFFMDEGGVLLAYRIGALTEEMLMGELQEMAPEN